MKPFALEHETPVELRERVLHLLGTARRPMRWVELTNALGLLSNDAHTACEWLMGHGYILPISVTIAAGRSAEAFWTLSDKGHAWAKVNDALEVACYRTLVELPPQIMGG